MTLQEQLASTKAKFTAKAPAEALKVMANATQELDATGIAQNAPKVGDRLSEFALPNQNGDVRKLSELLQNGPVVITFYRGGWCPYCNLELQAYQQVLGDIKAAGATLIAITPELPDASLSTAEKNELQFEVLSDQNAEYAKELGLVFTLPEELRPIYEQFGIDVQQHNGQGQYDLPLAATFVVDADGKVVFSVATADYTQRAEPTDVLDVLQRLPLAS